MAGGASGLGFITGSGFTRAPASRTGSGFATGGEYGVWISGPWSGTDGPGVGFPELENMPSRSSRLPGI